ncbi:MAG: cupin domain-containing protein [Anaerolineales bacterium]|jgi:mannose-6-phosphate isomerase-like protein (cupin superfamily)
MGKHDGIVKTQAETKVVMDEQEVVRFYFQTEKITFGTSLLKPGAVGGLDPGHEVADEVFYCAKGHVLCFFPENDTYYELHAGDALLIPPATGHKLFNIGNEDALITWGCAPHP